MFAFFVLKRVWSIGADIDTHHLRSLCSLKTRFALSETCRSFGEEKEVWKVTKTKTPHFKRKKGDNSSTSFPVSSVFQPGIAM